MSRAAARRVLGAVAVALLLASTAVDAAHITIVNNDDPAEGFNDPQLALPVGGNIGTTLGAQRLAAFQYAADRWAAALASSTTIEVDASFDPLPCSGTTAVLGSAGPTSVVRDFPGALLAGTWYAVALANKLAAADLEPGEPDLGASFNSTLGTTCSFPRTWYHGLDADPPAGTIDLVTVALHELAHGLGFLSLVDLDTGAKFLGANDAYMTRLEHHGTTELYPSMTNGERVAASQATVDLHWVGGAVVTASTGLVSGRHASGHVQMHAPVTQAPGSSVSHFSTSLEPDEGMEPSYTGPNHDLGLARALMTDLGWGSAQCGDGTLDPGEECEPDDPDGVACCSAACLDTCEADEGMPGNLGFVRRAALFKFVSTGTHDLPELASSDPTLTGGVLTVSDASGQAGAATLTLPPAGWSKLGSPAGSSGFRYRGAGVAGDPCRLVLVRSDLVKAVCRGPDVTVTPPVGSTLSLRLEVGDGKRYCATFGGTVVRNDVTVFKAKDAPPAPCLP